MFTKNKITLALVIPSLSLFSAASYANSDQANDLNETQSANTYSVIGAKLAKPITLDQPGVAIVTMEDIEQQQPMNVSEVFDAIPGISIDGGARSGGERINIRGFSDTESLNMLVDGAPIGFQQYRYGSFFFDPALISSAQVIKGAHDVKTGNGGFGGSFHIKTKDASEFLEGDDKFGARMQAGYNSNDDMQRYSLTSYARTDNGWQFLMNNVFKDAQDVEIGDGTTMRYSGYEQQNMLAKISYEQGDHKYKLSHTRYQDTGRKPWANRRGVMPTISAYNIKKYGSYEAALYAYTVDNEYTDNTTTFNYFYNPANPLVNLNLVVARSDNERHWRRPDIAWEKMYVSVGQYGHESWLTYQRDYADLANTFYLDDHTIMAGVQYQGIDRESYVFNKSQAKKENKNYGYYTPYYEPSGKQQTSSFYLKDDYQATNNLIISPSIRFDYIRSEGKGNLASDYNDASVGHDYSAVSHQGWIPRLGITYEVDMNTTLNFAYAYSLQAPTIDDIYSVQYAKASKTVSSSRDLKAERIHAYNLGLTFVDSDMFFAEDNFAAEIALFYNKVENDVAQRNGVNSTEKLQGWYTNLDGFYNYGAELMAQYRTKQVFINSSFAYTTGKHEGSYADSTGDDDYLATLPPITAKLELGYEWFKGFKTSWKLNWVNSQTEVAETGALHNAESEQYTLQELYMTWQPLPENKDFAINLAVKNLTDRYYETYLANGIAAPGRDIRANVIYKW